MREIPLLWGPDCPYFSRESKGLGEGRSFPDCGGCVHVCAHACVCVCVDAQFLVLSEASVFICVHLCPPACVGICECLFGQFLSACLCLSICQGVAGQGIHVPASV